jgi:hypothetical protein
MVSRFISVLIAQTHQVRYYREVTGQQYQKIPVVNRRTMAVVRLGIGGVVRSVAGVYDDPRIREARHEFTWFD